MMNEKSDFIYRYRLQTSILINALQQIQLLNDEYTRVDYGTLLQDADFADSDTLDKAKFTSTVANTEQILTSITAGMWTNLYSTRRT
jgi:hypothetical protein